MNNRQVETAAGDRKVWKRHLVFKAPEILRKEGLWNGPDWNKGDNIRIEAGTPSHLPDDLFPAGEEHRYILNEARDGFVFNPQADPELDPPPGQHNPIAVWRPDPNHAPPSGVGFSIISNPNAYQYDEGFWLPQEDALQLIVAMKRHAAARREGWRAWKGFDVNAFRKRYGYRLDKAMAWGYKLPDPTNASERAEYLKKVGRPFDPPTPAVSEPTVHATLQKGIDFSEVEWERNARGSHLLPDKYVDSRIRDCDIWIRKNGTGKVRVFSDSDMDNEIIDFGDIEVVLKSGRPGFFFANLTGDQVEEIEGE